MSTFLLQLGVCLAVWLGVGLGLALRVRHSLAPIADQDRGKKTLSVIGLYLMSAIVILSGMLGVFKARGIQNNVLLPWAWLMVTIIGLVFVLLQLRATVLVGCLLLKFAEPEPESGKSMDEALASSESSSGA